MGIIHVKSARNENGECSSKIELFSTSLHFLCIGSIDELLRSKYRSKSKQLEPVVRVEGKVELK